MRISLLAISLFLSAALTGNASAEMNLSVSMTDEGMQGFYASVGQYYNVPEKEVIVVKEKRIPDEEIPVVLFIASRAKVKPAEIVSLRLSGKTWADITLSFGLSPEIFYVPVKEPRGPYAKAYGKYKKPGAQNIRVEDDEVINLINLKFISEHYGCSPEDVMELRARGISFVEINHTIKKKGRHEKGLKGPATKTIPGGKGKGKH